MLRPWRLWYLFFIVFTCDLLGGAQSFRRDPWSHRFNGAPSRLGVASKNAFQEEHLDGRELELVVDTSGGPGSKPPRCEFKCGKCTPCTPVRVPVHPGPHKSSEYYPEAWRCKCKGKLYMP